MEVFNDFCIFIIGLVFGSFFNMLIYRLPLQLSLMNPKRSTCPECNFTIKWYENIPLLSYLLLKGRCSHCNTKISLSYLIVEILTAAVTLLLYKKLGFSIEFLFLTAIFYILIILSFIDFKYKAVPDYLLIIITTLTFIYLFLYNFQQLSIFFIFAGAIVTIELFVTYYIQNIKSYILKNNSLKSQKAIGEGDIPIIAIIGGILGLKFGIIAILLSATFAIIPSIVNKISNMEMETPFIPYLSLGFFLTFINENQLEKLLEGIM